MILTRYWASPLSIWKLHTWICEPGAVAVTVVCMKYFLSQGNIFLLAAPGPSCSFLPNCPHPMETAEVKIFLILLNIFIKFCFSTVHCCCCRCPLYSVNLCNFIKYNTESLYNLIRPIPERNTFPTVSFSKIVLSQGAVN